MLWHDGGLYFIDVGQSVEPSHPHGLEFLYRDCANIARFFSGVDECLTAQQLFNYVTGLNIHEDSEEAFLIQVHLRTFAMPVSHTCMCVGIRPYQYACKIGHTKLFRSLTLYNYNKFPVSTI